ncbi:hypothetical protein I317_04367 [Kwoniella heveanensis CBS 569]|nr:hypothetical protein I317_04367 [Kwoniella heveanensis CBS 569]
MSDDAETDGKSRKVQITPPLPLPIHFTVLPSLYPNKPLSPVLYVLVNDIPIYLTLDPAQPPHMSLLPLFMTLSPTSPLQILASLRLAPEHYSLTMEGIAPYIDIWAPLSLAREVCAKLGVGRLFWDDEDPLRGLLGMEVDDAMSWDDGEGIGHNWLPPTSQLPRSAYSLSSLMSAPISGPAIIQDNRFITTPLDHHVRIEILDESANNNHSKIREGKWAEAWDDLLILTDAAWREYLTHPSTPPTSHLCPRSSLEKIERGRGSELLYSLLPQLPALLHSSQKPTYSFSLPDLHRLLRSTSITTWQPAKAPKPLDLTSPHRIIVSVVSHLLQYRQPDTTTQYREQAERRMLDEMRYKARMSLSLAEHLGGVMMSGFLATHMVDRKTKSGGKSSKGKDKIKDKEKEREQKEDNATGMYIWIERVEALEKEDPTANEKSGLGQKDKQDWSSMIQSLEQQRGGSPPPALPSSRNDVPVPPFEQLPKLPSSRSDLSRDRDRVDRGHDLLTQRDRTHAKNGHQMADLPTPPQSPKVHTHHLAALGPDPTKHGRSSSHSHSRSRSRSSSSMRSRDFEYDSSSASDPSDRDYDPDYGSHYHHPQPKPRRSSSGSLGASHNGHRSWTGARPQPNPQPLDKITQFQLGDLSDTRVMLSENGNGWQGYRMLGWSILLGLLLGYFQLF